MIYQLRHKSVVLLDDPQLKSFSSKDEVLALIQQFNLDTETLNQLVKEGDDKAVPNGWDSGKKMDHIAEYILAGNLVVTQRHNPPKVENSAPPPAVSDVGNRVVDLGSDESGKTATKKFGPKPGESEPNWGNVLRNHGAGEPPKDMINPHAHHAVFKKGRGKQMQEYIGQSKEILEKHEIDWYMGTENLGWAPNKNHSTKAAKAVRDVLQKADTEVGTREAVVDALKGIKKHFADDTINILT